MEVVVTTGAISRAKLQSNHHHQQTNTQFFTGRMPFLSTNQQRQNTEGKISHSMDLFTPNSPGGLPTLSLTTSSSWLPWGRIKTARLVNIIRFSWTVSKNWCKTTTAVYCELEMCGNGFQHSHSVPFPSIQFPFPPILIPNFFDLFPFPWDFRVGYSHSIPFPFCQCKSCI